MDRRKTIDYHLYLSTLPKMMRHEITHRFHSALRVSLSCQICDRPMFYGVTCRDCNYSCHKNCAPRAPPSCGLPDEFLDMFAQTITTAKLEDNWGTRQNSVNAQDWEIPYDELTITEQIGYGRFGCDRVLKGCWHGDVAIRRLDLPAETPENKKSIELVKEMFSEEVANFRNTRHENLETFMGACMDVPRLAIVTTYCKADTLHDQIHLHKNRFSLNKIIQIAQQICLGMNYLHSRNILHKDLKSKNVFFDGKTVTIADFGLFNLKRLCRTEGEGPWIKVPRGWFAYLAPEIMRKLNPNQGSECDIEFTNKTDVYAFGTIWFELLTCELPYRYTEPEITIWQVGRGLKQPLVNLHASREIVNILVMCWSVERPTFSDLGNHLESLPPKRVQRSSSFKLDGCRF